MYYRLGLFCFDRRWWVIAAWAATTALLAATAPTWSKVAFDGDFDQLPADTTTTRARRLNAEAFPGDRAQSEIVLVFARDDGPLAADDRHVALSTAHELEKSSALPVVGEAWTEAMPVIGPTMRSKSERATRVVVRLANDMMAVDNIRVLQEVQKVVERRRADAPAGLHIGITGSAAIGGDALSAMAESLRNTDRTTIVLVALALAVIYRSPWLVIVPLATIGLGAVISLTLLSTLAGATLDHPGFWPPVRLFTTTRIFVIVLIFGAGTDFCLFLISRFREELGRGAGHREAIAQALAGVGSALAASAMTTVVGLAMMAFADFGKLAYSGPAIAVSLVVALLLCITLAPALLSTWAGARVAGSTLNQSDDAASDSSWTRFWASVAEKVTRRPGFVLAGSVLAGVPFAMYGANPPISYDVLAELPRDAVTRHGTNLLLAHFPAGDAGPLAVLARLPSGGLTTGEGRIKIAELTKHLFDLPGVEKVRSLYRPTGEAPGAMRLFSGEGLMTAAAASSPLAKETFVARLPAGRGDVTRLWVTLDAPPFAPQAVATAGDVIASLHALSRDAASPWHGAQFEFLGPTTGIRDLERVTQSDRTRIELLVAAAVFGVILVLLRRPLMCVFLIASVVGGYFVTMGLVHGLLDLFYGPEFTGFRWTTPIFLFVILVAVGQDYNIFLVTRVFEEQRRLPPLDGLRRAVAQTGGIITSCGVIMAATFASMLTASMRGMVELGLALSLGILLDTFFVRTVVVPAYLAILARRRESGLPAAVSPGAVGSI
jgi:RND superfamily putative drug exporter